MRSRFDLKEIFYLLLSHWKSIFLAMLIGAAIFGAYHTFLLKPSYQADASIYITSTDSMISFSDLQLSAALTRRLCEHHQEPHSAEPRH